MSIKDILREEADARPLFPSSALDYVGVMDLSPRDTVQSVAALLEVLASEGSIVCMTEFPKDTRFGLGLPEYRTDRVYYVSPRLAAKIRESLETQPPEDA